MKQGQGALGSRHIVGAVIVVAALAAPSCKSEDKVADSKAPKASSSPAAASVAGEATPVTKGLGDCVVGMWETTRVSLQMKGTAVEGGVGIQLEVTPGGNSTIDFDKMSRISATTTPTTYEFSYSGKSTAKLSSPSPGALIAEKPDYSKVRVTAEVSIPGAGSVELFKGASLAELVKASQAAAEVDDGLPLPEPSDPPPETIDAKPIFSSNRYTCAGDQLKLSGVDGGTVWEFARVK